MSRFGNLGARLYKGEVSYDFIGKAKTWYAVSAVLLLLSIGAFLFRGLDYGVEFEGGAVFIADAPGGTVAEAREAVLDAGVEEIGDPIVTQLGGDSIRVETLALTPERSTHHPGGARRGARHRARRGPATAGRPVVGWRDHEQGASPA